MYFSVKRLNLNNFKRLARILKVIFTLLSFQVGEKLVSKRDKSKKGLQSSQDSLETKRKRCLYDFFFL